MYDLIIIGGGPAGLTAATYARRAGLSTLVLESSACGGQIINSNNVENYPTIQSIPGWQLADSWKKQAVSQGAEILSAAVTEIVPEERLRRVETTKGCFQARTVIIANGAKSRKLDCPGADTFIGKGVSSCASCDGAFFRGKDVAVVGGGNTAMEDALYLAALCTSVTVVHRRNEFRADRQLVQSVKSKHNVTLLTPYVPQEILGDEDGQAAALLVRHAETGEVATLETPGIFTAIGMVPDNARFANVADLDENGYIVAGEDCRTKTEGVFAAGDTRTKTLRQLVTAAADGAMAATQAARIVQSWRD